MDKTALLMLDDGLCLSGLAAGAAGESAGEVVFTTGVSGYQETLTDPSFMGQIVAFTSAHLGNYGVSQKDDEASRPLAAGAVFHELFERAPEGPFPHWRAVESLNERLRRENVTAITGVDTRALTLHLRKHGSRNGIISALDLDKGSLLEKAKALPSMSGRALALEASCRKAYEAGPPASEIKGPGRPLEVAVLDYGLKRSILKNLTSRGVRVKVWPAASEAEDILAAKPDGILLSNGPGDPEPLAAQIKTIKKLLGRAPVFGICLGHQLLGLALGAKAYKMDFGHHGLNHPVKDAASGRVMVTSQNHCFALDAESLPPGVRPSHWNLNDGSLEGLACPDLSAFSVQFHPEAAPGASDAKGLFDDFIKLMGKEA